MSLRLPGKPFKWMVFFIVNHYIPSWFKIKCQPHCQSGAENFYNMVSLAKDLPMMERKVVKRVLQTKCFWAHGENIIIGYHKEESCTLHHGSQEKLKPGKPPQEVGTSRYQL